MGEASNEVGAEGGMKGAALPFSCQEKGWKDAGGPGSSLPDDGLLLPLCHQLRNCDGQTAIGSDKDHLFQPF